jgi:type II secretory pathway pseudopilin PulG
MYRLLTVVAALALISLGTTIVASVLQNSTTSRQTRQLNKLSHEQAMVSREFKTLRGEVQKIEAKVSTNTATTSAVLGTASHLALAGKATTYCAVISRSGSLASRSPRRSCGSPSGKTR